MTEMSIYKFAKTKSGTGGNKKNGPLYTKRPVCSPGERNLYLHQLHLRVIKGDASPHLVDHAGVLQMGIDPHGSIGMDAGCATLVALDDLAVYGDILCTGGPVAVPQGKGYHAGADGLGDLHLADHRLLLAILEVIGTIGIGSRKHLDLVATLQSQLFGILSVNDDAVFGHGVGQ